MNPIGSFYPLANDDPSAPAVLFAYAAATPAQQQALRNEAMARITAVSSLSEALLMVQVEAPGRSGHVPLLEAIAILSRDAKGLLVAAGCSGG